jgi:hypothetical protein
LAPRSEVETIRRLPGRRPRQTCERNFTKCQAICAIRRQLAVFLIGPARRICFDVKSQAPQTRAYLPYNHRDNQLSTVRDLLTLPNASIRLPWMRIGSGCLFGILTVAGQTLFFSEAPIHFTPSLVAVAMATLYWGHKAGVTILVTSAVLINYALLHPRWARSSSIEALNATAVNLVVAVVLVVAVGPLHQRLSRLERSLESAQGEAATEAQLRKNADDEFHARLSEMQRKCEKVLDPHDKPSPANP